jgi:hypothetical protein
LLVEAKVINATAVIPFLPTIDDGVDDEGYTALRRQHIEAVSKTESTKFMFNAAGDGQRFTGVRPGESGDGGRISANSGVNPFDSITYDEAAQMKLFIKIRRRL